jgi:hypothetical protein
VAALKQGAEAGESKSANTVVRYQDIFRQNTNSCLERSLTALSFFEERLRDQATGFLVGDSVTYVDLGLFYMHFEFAECDNVPEFTHRFPMPHRGTFLERIEQRSHLLDYRKSPRRMPRYKRDSDGASLYAYVAASIVLSCCDGLLRRLADSRVGASKRAKGDQTLMLNATRARIHTHIQGQYDAAMHLTVQPVYLSLPLSLYLYLH